MKKLPILLFLLTICCCQSLLARKADVTSPDKQLRLRVYCGDSLEYRVEYKGRPLIARSRIGLDIAELPHGAPVVVSMSRRSVDDSIRPLYGKTDRLSERYNELRIDFQGGWSLLMRAYDEGVAYRFVTDLPGRVVVRSETARFNIPDDPGSCSRKPPRSPHGNWPTSIIKASRPSPAANVPSRPYSFRITTASGW